MLKEFYTAAMGMLPQQTRLEVTANNLANANTTGFKRASVFERSLIDARAHFYEVQGDAEQEDPPHGSYIDFSQGSFEQTHNPLDVAIDRKNGFFVVQDSEGNEYLSKNGHFKLSPEGRIVSMDGKVLMGESGPLTIRGDFFSDKEYTNDKTSMSMKITENGEVLVNERSVGAVMIMDVENLNSLENVSNSDFIMTNNTIANVIPQEEVLLRQGWLENSNVDIVREMVGMIELQRMFELGSKVIKTNDDTLEPSIRLGRFQ